MWSYISRRTIQGVFIMVIITIVLFALTRASSDPMSVYANKPNITQADRDRIRASLGLDQPWPIQYASWLGFALHGDLGTSFFSRLPVTTLMGQRLPLTLVLMVVAQFFIVVISLGLGIISAVKPYSVLDQVITAFSFIGLSMPIFFIALGSLYIFAVQFKAWGLPYLPTGADVWKFTDPAALAWHLVLPVSCLTIIQVAGYSRFLRSSILEVLGLDYVRTARAKGLVERDVLFRHALRNAALPFITILGLDIPFLLGGALVTESIFSWPGMGRLFWEYAQRGDYPVVNGVLLVVSTAVVFFAIVVDVAYTFIDPRIQLS